MTKLTFYYIIIAAILIGKSATTLYQRSVVVHHGHSVASLQSKKQSLSEEQLTITAKLAQVNSLSSVEKSGDTNSFQPISTPLLISKVQLATSQL